MWEKSAEYAFQQFLTFFGLNFLALYIPALVPILLIFGDNPIALLISPLMLVELALNRLELTFGLLVFCFVGVGFTSAFLFRNRAAWWVVPSVLGVYSFVQATITFAMLPWYE
jgi:hypothetical protein